MRPLPSADILSLTRFDAALTALEDGLRQLADLVGECPELTARDRQQLADNVSWLRRYLDAAEATLARPL